MINPDCEMDAAVPIYSIDCNTVTDAELQAFQSEFSFRAMFPGELHGFCAYFDVVFGPEIVVLSTSPHAVPTHWQQSLFYFDKPVGFCPQHQEIKGEIRGDNGEVEGRSGGDQGDARHGAGRGWQRGSSGQCQGGSCRGARGPRREKRRGGPPPRAERR